MALQPLFIRGWKQLSAYARTAATILSFVETSKLMKKNILDFFKGFFGMIVGGRTDYEQMAQALLCVNEK